MRRVREVLRFEDRRVGLNELRIYVALSTVQLRLKRLANAGFN